MVADGGLAQAITDRVSDQPRRLQLGWMLTMLAVGLPAATGIICGCLWAIAFAEFHGASLAAPRWLGTALWLCDGAGTGLLVALAAVPWLKRRLARDLYRLMFASLALTSALCGVASVAAS